MFEEISDEKVESLSIARLAFFANLREDIEFLRDLIIMAETPEMSDMIEDRLDRAGYNVILPQNR